MIAVTFAVADEGRDFERAMQQSGLPVRVLYTGIGPEISVARLRRFLEQTPEIKILVSSGFAGGLNPALAIGEVIVGTNFCDANLLQRISNQPLPKFQLGTLNTQTALVETAAAKCALFAETGCDAVDMETAHLFAECSARGIAMLSIRAISDTAAQSMPVPNHVWFDLEKQRPRIFALLAWLATHPAAIPVFARFVKGISFTRRQLTQFLIAAIQPLAKSA